jgi:DNA-binding NtrC family response regulator
MNGSILIVDDEIGFRNLYRQILESAGFNTLQAASAHEALDLIKDVSLLMVVSDIRMPGASGIELLRKTRELRSELPFLLITAYADVQDAVHAMKLGAVDYLAKPVDLDEFVAAVQDVLGVHGQGRTPPVPPEKLSGIVMESPSMQSAIKDAYRVAESDANVLILGESGTGKEIVAGFIHKCSPRRDKPMITVNCAAIPGTLMASELFGHEKGAFTGADKCRKGPFRESDGGTLFLDEIGDMPLELQTAVLRAIETGRILPVGSDREIATDFRLLAATNRNLERDIREGRFRQDLYYRLNVIAVHIPPIRERKEDILPLARHFLSRGQSDGKTLSRAACEVLTAYPWPGNVREISNAMEHVRLLSPTPIIGPEHLPPAIRKSASPRRAPDNPEAIAAGPAIKTLEENQIENIRLALKKTDGNRTHAAEILGISRRGLIHKLKRFGIV